MRTIIENAEKTNGGNNLMAMMGFEPDKAIDVMMLINARQLNNMADSLLYHYPKTTQIGKKLTKAIELLSHLKVNDAAAIIEDIIYNGDHQATVKEAIEKMIAGSREMGEQTIDMLRNGVIPEFILQVPSSCHK